MKKRKSHGMRTNHRWDTQCRSCGKPREPGKELSFHGYCGKCRAEYGESQKARGRRQRAKVGARLLGKAQEQGTVEREGRQFRVVALPAKKPKRRKRKPDPERLS